MDFSLDRIRSACKESKHAEIIKMPTLPSHNEPFVVQAMDRCCSICINIFLWRINFDENFVRGSKRISSKRRDNLLHRIEYFAKYQQHIQALLDTFREERFETLKSIFCFNEFAVRNFAYQLALERELKEGKSDALLLFLQWDKEQLEEKFDMHKLFFEKLRRKSIAEVDPHFHVVSKLCNFMLRLDLSDAGSLTGQQQKKIKLDENVPFVSEIYERLKMDESVMIKKWFERKFGIGYQFFIMRDLESNLLQIYRKALKSYYAYYLVNYPSLIEKFDIENERRGQSLLEYALSTPEVGISVEILSNFVKAKPSIVNWIKEKTGDSILHVYVKSRTGSPEIVRFMVEELGLDPLQENKAKENALESFLNARWSKDTYYQTCEEDKEILEYLEAKIPLNGAEFIQKFSIFTGFFMVYRVAYNKSPYQQFFLQYAIEKFYGPEINADYPLIERFREYYGPDLYKTGTHYEVVAFLHSIFNENNFYTTIWTKFEFGILRNSGPMSFIDGRICDLIAKLYDESDENLKLFIEIIMKIERIYTKCSSFQTYPKILSCLPPYDENSKEGFKKMHIERMIRVFNKLISERNNACGTIQDAIEAWNVEDIATDILNFKYNDRSDQDSEEEISLKSHKLMKKIIQSGLFAALYSFTCHWEFTLRDQDDLNDHHYEEMKMFLRKSELFIPGSLYTQEGDVFSLKHLCRLEIRQMLSKDGYKDMATYVEMIESLGLPKKMENYIHYLPECCKNE